MSYRPDNDQTIIMAKARRTLSSSNITIWSMLWLLLTLTVYLLFSVVFPTHPQPLWFKITTYALSGIALITTSLLCYRNWRHQRVLGITWTWLLLSFSTFFYLTGKITLLTWELSWGSKPNVSLADLAFSGFYLLMAGAVGLFLVQQHIALNRQQSMILMVVSGIATVIAFTMINSHHPSSQQLATTLPINHWLIQIAQQLQPLSSIFRVFYIAVELVLILMATVLSIGFWSGRLGKTWQIVAQGLACLYVADLRFAYLTQTTGHASGDLMEIVWIAGILQLGIAAAVEWESAYGVKRLLR